MKKPKIPFAWWPGHWGLTGKTRERAQAEYELSGFDLDMRLAEIDHEDLTQRQIKQLQIQQKHGRISDYEHDLQLVKITNLDETEQQQALLEVEFKHNKITSQIYERKMADLKQEPWVSMPDIKWDPQDPARSYFELDYNEHFITFLRSHNYNGLSDDQVVERWLTDVCRSVAQEFHADDPTFVSEAPAPVLKRRQPKKKKTEYS